jgi:hypothetical protein
VSAPRLQRDPMQVGTYWYLTGPTGEALRIQRGYMLDAALPITAKFHFECWYVTTHDGRKLLGNPDGYDTLRDVREHIAAVNHDHANGYDVRWGA